MKKLNLKTVIQGVELIDSNMMQTLQGGYTPMIDCCCGSANSNGEQQPGSDCTCGSANNNKAVGQDCTCGLANSNLVKTNPMTSTAPAQKKTTVRMTNMYP